MHGYMSETEPWKYGAKVEGNMQKMLNLRYRLLPYIYSEAWQVSSRGSTIMRPLLMDFRDDEQALSQPYQYMFGANLLVAPITAPGVSEWSVYLPAAPAWYDFWSGRRYEGKQNVNAAAPLDRLPSFVKAGAILPLGPALTNKGKRSRGAAALTFCFPSYRRPDQKSKC